MAGDLIKDSARYILEKTMDCEVEWHLSEAEEYLAQLKEIKRRSKLPLDFKNTSYKRDSIRKARSLRKKIRMLDWNSATKFLTWIEAPNVSPSYPNGVVKYRVEIEIKDEDVYMTFWDGSYGWVDRGVERGTYYGDGERISSLDVSEIAMFPAFLRDREAVTLHKESKHVKKDF